MTLESIGSNIILLESINGFVCEIMVWDKILSIVGNKVMTIVYYVLSYIIMA